MLVECSTSCAYGRISTEIFVEGNLFVPRAFCSQPRKKGASEFLINSRIMCRTLHHYILVSSDVDIARLCCPKWNLFSNFPSSDDDKVNNLISAVKVTSDDPKVNKVWYLYKAAGFEDASVAWDIVDNYVWVVDDYLFVTRSSFDVVLDCCNAIGVNVSGDSLAMNDVCGKSVSLKKRHGGIPPLRLFGPPMSECLLDARLVTLYWSGEFSLEMQMNFYGLNYLFMHYVKKMHPDHPSFYQIVPNFFKEMFGWTVVRDPAEGCFKMEADQNTSTDYWHDMHSRFLTFEDYEDYERYLEMTRQPFKRTRKV